MNTHRRTQTNTHTQFDPLLLPPRQQEQQRRMVADTHPPTNTHTHTHTHTHTYTHIHTSTHTHTKHPHTPTFRCSSRGGYIQALPQHNNNKEVKSSSRKKSRTQQAATVEAPTVKGGRGCKAPMMPRAVRGRRLSCGRCSGLAGTLTPHRPQALLLCHWLQSPMFSSKCKRVHSPVSGTVGT